MQIHGREGEFGFRSPDASSFAEWLWQRNGRRSALGWAGEIEHEAQVEAALTLAR